MNSENNQDDTPEQVEDDSDPVEVAREAEMDSGKVLPLHAAPRVAAGGRVVGNIEIKRQRGRPRKVENRPTTSDLEYHAQISEEKQQFIARDPVVAATSATHIESPELLRKLRTEIAREAAALHFQRIENEKYGRDTSQVSSRRIDALTKIANIELDIKKLGVDMIDLRGEKFQRIFKMWIEMIKETTEETLPPEVINLFFNRLSTKMEGWEDKAEEVIR